MKERETAVILFDGVCHFCNGAVQFIMKRDRHAYFRFAPLQSSVGQRLLAGRPDLQGTDSIVLIEQGFVFTESTAVLKIAKHLNGLWKIALFFLIVPKSIRDPLYRYVARNRYRWFGESETCLMPTAEMKDRFL